MKLLIARLRHFLTGKHDPMDLLNGVYERTLPDRLTISRGMLKSEYLASQASDLVAKLFQRRGDNEFSFAQKLRRLPKHWGALEAVMFYHTMVDNGGHDRYFGASEGAFCDLVEDGLRLFAGDYHRHVFQRALGRYRPELYAEYAPLDSARPVDLRTPYDDLDGLYYKADPKLPTLVDRFICSNLELYRS